MEPSKTPNTPDTPLTPNTSNSPFTAIYAQWLDSFRALFPGSDSSGPAEAAVHKEEQVAAHQDWEDEGGSVKPVPVPEAKDAPKIPF